MEYSEISIQLGAGFFILLLIPPHQFVLFATCYFSLIICGEKGNEGMYNHKDDAASNKAPLRLIHDLVPASLGCTTAPSYTECIFHKNEKNSFKCFTPNMIIKLFTLTPMINSKLS